MNFAPFQAAERCTGGPTDGARALLAWLLESYPQAESLGIYNCRSVRGGSTTSLHGEGRAVDLKWPMSSAGRGTASGVAVVERLAAHGERLGIQCIIYNRTIWSARSPQGRPYTGAHPHYDHLHIELTRAAAERLTLATLRDVLGDDRGSQPEQSEPETSSPAQPSRSSLASALPTVRFDQGTPRGGEVRTVQSLLGARGRPPGRTFQADGQPDGIGGRRTRDRVGEYQAARRTGRPSSPATPDHIVGEATWVALLGTVRTIRFDEGTVRGGVVRTIQALLAARGYPPGRSFTNGRPDGIGAARTRDALAAFQRDTNTGDGSGNADLIVGPRTWDALTGV